MGSGPAARVWQEQTNHKLVRHPASDTTRYRNYVAVDAKAKGGSGCFSGDVKEEVDETIEAPEAFDPVYGVREMLSRRHLTSPQSLIFMLSFFFHSTVVGTVLAVVDDDGMSHRTNH